MTGTGIRSTFTVTESGEKSNASAAVQQQVDDARAQYHEYVEDQTKQLLDGTKRFVAAYQAGDDAKSRALYPTVRVHWERIEPVAESFGDLDPKTDAREADLSPGQRWTGWHRIEKDLWPEQDPTYHALSPAARGAMAENLMRNTQVLSQKIGTLTFTTDQIANGSSGLMEEVATSKITGEEEYWSHTDLWDFAANVKGARVAFEDVRPILLQRDPTLARTLSARFGAIDRLLARQRDGHGYRLYTDLRRAEVKRLADAVNALAEPLSHLTAAVLP
jgi:iron uptake system component EfeO